MAFESTAYPPVNWNRGLQIFPSGDPDEIKRGEFGRAVGVSGNNAIVGGPRTDHKDKLINTQATGRVYFYVKDGNGNWNLNNFFDDPEVGIKWPVKEAIISERDRANPYFYELRWS